MNNQGLPVSPTGGGDGVGLQPPQGMEGNNMVPLYNRVVTTLRPHDPQGARLNDHGRVNMNIAESNRSLVLPTLSLGYTFIVTSILMQIFTMVGSFAGLPVDDQHSHLDRLNFVCISCIGRPDWDINVIRPRVFPMSLTGDATLWFNNIPYNLICSWISSKMHSWQDFFQ